MKKLLVLTLSLIVWLTTFAQVNPYNHTVKGYHRKDGTYVRPHKRTNPNSTNRDNYTTKPNTNPYTGKRGYIQPDNNYYAPTPVVPIRTKAFQNNLALIEAALRHKQSEYDRNHKVVKYYYRPVQKNTKTRSIPKREREDHEENMRKMQRHIIKNRPVQKRIKTRLVPKREWEDHDETVNTTHYKLKTKPSTQKTIYHKPQPQSNINEAANIRHHNQFTIANKLHIEKLLKKWGMFTGIADGHFTDRTIQAIRIWQTKYSTNPTGRLSKSRVAMFMRMR